MSASIQGFLFGDQTLNVSHGLRQLLNDKSSSALRSFFESALQVIRIEYASLPRNISSRSSCIRFSTIGELLSLQEEGQLPTEFDPAFTCLYQLGVFIRYHDQPGHYYPAASGSLLFGLCTGAIAAAAVSSSNSVSELVETALQSVRIAFRLGCTVADLARKVSPEKEAVEDDYWSLFILETNETEASLLCSEYSAAKKLPSTSRPYLSSISDRGVSISGPTSVLRDISASGFLSHKRVIQLPIRGPFHAGHLFNLEDVHALFDSIADIPCLRWTARHTLISSSTGKPIQGDTFSDLLRAALYDILCTPIRWKELGSAALHLMKARDAVYCSLSPIGSTAGDGLCAAIRQSCKEASFETEVFQHVIEDLAVEADETLPGSHSQSKIAIVGSSGRYPGADNNEEFWELLRQGLDMHKEVPAVRWDVKSHVDVEGKKKNTGATPWGCWLDNAGLWDARFFNISPREAPQIDPAQRLALLTAYEAIEQAGIVPGATPSTQKDRVGVFYGVTSNDWMETNSAQNIDTYFIPGGNRAFIPGRINYFFKFSGPSYAVDTACSSSLAAIHIACNSLWRGDIDTAIAGGTNILTNPDFTAGLDRGHFLSRSGNCKTFDDEADGYCRGEAVGTVILKRLEDALHDGDPIQGVILSAYTNHSAEAESITRPSVEAQKAIFRRILGQAGVDARDVSYVECHGTGTQAGDAGEMESVTSIFAPTRPSKSGKPVVRQSPLYLSSAKSNIGHGEGASGVSSLAKVLLMMKHNIIPPHCGIKTRINHKFPQDLGERNVHIPTNAISWPRPTGGVRRALVNNFSAAGGNTALLIEDAKMTPRSPTSLNSSGSGTSHLIAVTAKSFKSLTGNLGSLLSVLDNTREGDDRNFIASLSYTTTARRIHHAHRVMLQGTNIANLKSSLAKAISEGHGKTRPKRAPEVVFTFTGQGAQYAGMGKDLYLSFSVFQNEIKRLERLALGLGFPGFVDYILGEVNSDNGIEHDPVTTQLATVSVQMAMGKLWISWGVQPSAGVIGHSLGEYAALNAAGVLSDADTIYLVGARARLLAERCKTGTHMMLAVLSSIESIKEHLQVGEMLPIEIACINSPKEVVLSGEAQDIERAADTLKTHGFKTTLLRVPYAFHSAQVEPVLSDFEALATSLHFREPVVPILSPLLGGVIPKKSHDRILGATYLADHCRKTVNMVGALRAATEGKVVDDNTIFIEFGPHPVVSSLIKATLGPEVRATGCMRRNQSVWQTLNAALAMLWTAGMDIDWAEYHRDSANCHQVLQLPAYSWDLKDYWIQYIHDWSLRKGDPLPVMPVSGTMPLSTTTVHNIVTEKVDGDEITLVVVSDISRSDLNPLVQGHRVNDIPLCTPSVYADMGLTLGNYLAQKYPTYGSKSESSLIDVGHLAVEKALIAKPHGSQLLQATVVASLRSCSGTITFSSIDEHGKKTAQHANCRIQSVKTAESRAIDLQNRMSTIKQRISNLYDGLKSGATYRFNSRMTYLMVRSLAQFHDDYRCIDEVIMDSTSLEAVGWVDFAKAKQGDGDRFSVHPAYIDAMTQIGGFVMNANDEANLEKEVFINHGWRSCQIFQELDAHAKYRTYVKMATKEGAPGLWEGDVVVFDSNDTVVASFEGVELQAVPRRVLHYILAAESAGTSIQLGTANAAATQKRQQQSSTPAVKQGEMKPSESRTSSETASKVLRIIEEESGISMSELSNETSWADIGVDSLLSLVISSRLKEELHVDIDSSDFLTMPTVGHMKAFLSEGSNSPAIFVPEPSESDMIPRDVIPSMGPSNHLPPCSANWDAMVKIISEESGIAVQELTDDTRFADIGIDSLLSLVITSRCSEELGLEIDGNTQFSLEYPRVGDLRNLISEPSTDGSTDDGISTPFSLVPSTSTPDADDYATPLTDVGVFETKKSSTIDLQLPDQMDRGVSTVARATSVVLQGSKHDAKRNLIFFPDGSGSAFSYADLPRIADDTVAIGLNCPFLREPEQMASLSLDDVIDLYLAEVCARQPQGPYHLAGWSSGGIFAYRAAQRLIEEQGAGVVATLVLIDSPEPLGLDRLPARFFEHLSKHGVFDGMRRKDTPEAGGKIIATRGPPRWLVPHFNATIELLETYYAQPLDFQTSNLKAWIIWAGESVMDGVRVPKLEPADDDTEGMKFLSEQRRDFTAGAWAELFPAGTQIVAERMQGANHFSMMHGNHATRLVDFLRRAME